MTDKDSIGELAIDVAIEAIEFAIQRAPLAFYEERWKAALTVLAAPRFVDGCVLPDGAPLLAGSTEPVNNDAGRTTLDGRSAAGVEEKGDYQ